MTVTNVPTEDNLADLFTKALDRDPFVLNCLAKGILGPYQFRVRGGAACQARLSL